MPIHVSLGLDHDLPVPLRSLAAGLELTIPTLVLAGCLRIGSRLAHGPSDTGSPSRHSSERS